MIYFNEFDPFASEWICNLFPNQTIDDRSIKEVSSDDLSKFERCHFFAGIGGWEYALQIAGWPGGLPVWTGSCPCQPLSSAGKQLGEKDERHLWPEFYRLISECRPPVIFGEQVANPLGREWLDGISIDLEELGYTVGAADLCAASVDAPHIRQRIYWVAYSNGTQSSELKSAGDQSLLRAIEAGGLADSDRCSGAEYVNQSRRRAKGPKNSTVSRRDHDRLAYTQSPRHEHPGHGSQDCKEKTIGERLQRSSERNSDDQRLDNTKCVGRASGRKHHGSNDRIVTGSTVSNSWLGDTETAGPQRHNRHENRSDQSGWINSQPWGSDHSTSLACQDGKTRRIPLPESGIQPLAYGLSRSLGRGRTKTERLGIRSARTNRVSRLRGYGNAIVPQVAAIFIKCFLEIYGETKMTTKTGTLDQSENVESESPMADEYSIGPDSDDMAEVDDSIDANDDSEPADDESIEPESDPNDDDGDPLTDAQNRLIKIENAGRYVRQQESLVEGAKEDLKSAKANYDQAVARLRNLCEAESNDADRPLINGLKDGEIALVGVSDDDESSDVDQSWQSLAIETLWQADEIKGFGTAKRAAIIDEVTTLGEFQKLTQQVGKDCQHLKELLPQGCGEKLADELENRFLEFVANYANRDASNETESTENPDFKLKEFIADLTSDENWMAELESDDNFEAGKADFLDGETLEDLQSSVLKNHAIDSESLKQWCLGFAYAQREWEAEQDSPVDHDADQYEDVEDHTDETVEPDLQSAVAGIDEL